MVKCVLNKVNFNYVHNELIEKLTIFFPKSKKRDSSPECVLE